VHHRFCVVVSKAQKGGRELPDLEKGKKPWFFLGGQEWWKGRLKDWEGAV